MPKNKAAPDEIPLKGKSLLYPIPRWLSHGSKFFGTPGLTDPWYTYKILISGQTHFESNPGPQTHALFWFGEEIICGGSRGGGKSKWLIAKPTVPDVSLPEDDPARHSYLNDKDYRGLFLREEYQSLVEFIEEAIEFYKPLGGKATGTPVHIDFPSEARIYFNHLQDENAFTKYKGWNLTFIGIEELTTIRTLKQYLKLKGSLRSVPRVRTIDGKRRVFPALRTQLASTTNPDGPGGVWVMDRFVYVPDKYGKDIPWGTPMLDTITDSWRIFIPFPIDGNPYFGEETSAGKRYRANLMAQDEVTRKQWLYGDWRAGSSLFFTEYRPNGPATEEEKEKFPWACHIIRAIKNEGMPPVYPKLQPWWHRFSGGDWAYLHPAAFHKACRNEQDHRIHVYDELQVRQMGAFELGAILAKWWHPELMQLMSATGEAQVVMYIGSDMFRKTDQERTIAEQMAAGVREVLGPYGAILMKMTDAERELSHKNPRMAQYAYRERLRQAQGHASLVLKPCWPERIAAWQYVRDLLRWRPAILSFNTEEQREEYLRGVLASEGQQAYELQAEALRKAKPEILPKVVIWDRCVELDRCLRVAQRIPPPSDPSKPSRVDDVQKFNADDEGQNGDDSLESFRNLCWAFKEEIETSMPMSVFVNERIEAIQEEYERDHGERLTDPTRLMMIAQTQQANYNKLHASKSVQFNLPSSRNIRNGGRFQ